MLVQFPGCGRVELGATWLHGLAGNPLYDYAVEQGLMSSKADQKGGVQGLTACFTGFTAMCAWSSRRLLSMSEEPSARAVASVAPARAPGRVSAQCVSSACVTPCTC